MISIVIPTYQEAANIGRLVRYLRQYAVGATEIIVSDGGSTDQTLGLAGEAGAIAVLSPAKGRAAQMNYGASVAKGQILYFVHADTFPPGSYCTDIGNALNKGFALGRYRTKFDSLKRELQFNAFFTRFDLFICYGGDQTFFITRELFSRVGGFNAGMRIMEDYDLTARARKQARYCILPKAVLVSARKYDTNSWWQVQRANYTIVKMFQKGASQEAMVQRYREMLDYR